jgi:hypothetical protein
MVAMTSPTILRDIANLAERSRLFDQAIDAAKIHDDKGFREAMSQFWDKALIERSETLG